MVITFLNLFSRPLYTFGACDQMERLSFGCPRNIKKKKHTNRYHICHINTHYIKWTDSHTIIHNIIHNNSIPFFTYLFHNIFHIICHIIFHIFSYKFPRHFSQFHIFLWWLLAPPGIPWLLLADPDGPWRLLAATLGAPGPWQLLPNPGGS